MVVVLFVCSASFSASDVLPLLLARPSACLVGRAQGVVVVFRLQDADRSACADVLPRRRSSPGIPASTRRSRPGGSWGLPAQDAPTPFAGSFFRFADRSSIPAPDSSVPGVVVVFRLVSSTPLYPLEQGKDD
jgi:hypothetical protein